MRFFQTIKAKLIGLGHPQPDTGFHQSKSCTVGLFPDLIFGVYPSNKRRLFWKNFMPVLVKPMPEADRWPTGQELWDIGGPSCRRTP
jgi:hypothetical protein